MQTKAEAAPKASERGQDTVEISDDARRASSGQLTPEQQEQVEKLKARDAEVRTHEAAHVAAAGGHAKGGPVYEYTTGPDGKQYVINGHVNIDTSTVPGNPRATVEKMRAIQRAATAPAEPSGQDMAVAAKAAAMEQRAQQELRASTSQQKTETGRVLDLVA
jgi:hypothetical protein